MVEIRNNPTYRALWDLHESVAFSRDGSKGPIAPPVSNTQFYVALSVARRIVDYNHNPSGFGPTLDLLWLERYRDFTTQVRESLGGTFFREFRETANVFLAPPINNSAYCVFNDQKGQLQALNKLGVKSTICTGAAFEKEGEVQAILDRSGATNLFDCELPMFLRPPTISNSALSKALVHVLRRSMGETTIAIDNEGYILDLIDAITYRIFSNRTLTFQTISRKKAMRFNQQEERKLPRGADLFIDRQERIYADEFNLLLEKIKGIKNIESRIN